MAASSRSSRRKNAPFVLIVHEDSGRTAAWSEALQRQGFAVRSTRDGERALCMVAETTPVAVVLDLDLPDIDPLDVAAALRAHSRTARVVIIAVASRLSHDVLELATHRGCDVVLDGWRDAQAMAEAIAEHALGLRRSA